MRRWWGFALVVGCPADEVPVGDAGTGSSSGAADSATSVLPVDDTSAGEASTSDTGEPASTGVPSDFLMPFDHGTVSFECDQFAQDCPAGYKCMPYAMDGGGAWDATGCFPIAEDPAAVDEACTAVDPVSGIDDCVAGAMCWNVDENGDGSCVAMCTGSIDNPTCADPEEHCATSGSAAIALCLTICDPVAQDCPLEGDACYPVNDWWLCAPDDSGERAGGYGDPCQFINACDSGLVCVGPTAFSDCPSSSCCTSTCDVLDAASDAACAALDPAQSCEPWYLAPPPGYEHVGTCTVPTPPR